jgi:hypothetical protein
LGSNLIPPSHRQEDRAPPCDLPTVYITSRASTGECVPPHAAPAKIVNPNPPARSHPTCQSRTARVHRVTAAPVPSCVGRVVHVAALRGLAVTGRGGCERRTLLAACSGAVLGWVCVYSVTGCTADSSRVESGAWWWHCPSSSAGVFPPTRGEAHPPYSEAGAVRGHPPAQADSGELTHGELPLHPALGYPAAMPST